MIIDCHGHFTTVPKSLNTWRQKQLDSNGNISPSELKITDDELRETLEGGQIKRIRERGTDPETGHYYDDTLRYVSATLYLDERSRQDLFFNNILNVYPRLKTKVAS